MLTALLANILFCVFRRVLIILFRPLILSFDLFISSSYFSSYNTSSNSDFISWSFYYYPGRSSYLISLTLQHGASMSFSSHVSLLSTELDFSTPLLSASDEVSLKVSLHSSSSGGCFPSVKYTFIWVFYGSTVVCLVLNLLASFHILFSSFFSSFSVNSLFASSSDHSLFSCFSSSLV